jgi:CMP-N,N'-diacetyllegionaminic acid synthase
MKKLILIPARKGSKGLPGKNIKPLGGKPLIAYSIEYALSIYDQDDLICISTDDDEVISIAESHKLTVPFKRPEELSSDFASTEDVMRHAVHFFEKQELFFDLIVLLQPTSPFREKIDFQQVVDAYDDDCDMVVTVKESKDNPYFNLFEEDTHGYLKKSKEGDFRRRQDCPPVFAYNGSIYMIRSTSLKKNRMVHFKKIRKVIMPMERSIDIDTISDWALAEFYFENSKK